MGQYFLDKKLCFATVCNVAKAFRTHCPLFSLIDTPFLQLSPDLILIVQIFLTAWLWKWQNECQVFEMQSFLLCQIINAFWHDKKGVQQKKASPLSSIFVWLESITKSLIFYHMQHGWCKTSENVVENVSEKWSETVKTVLLFSDIC